MIRFRSERLAEFQRLRRRLAFALLALFLLLVVGVVGFSLIGRGAYGLVDAAYMTVITLTTVGYTEVIDMSGNEGGRVFTMLFLLFGMGILAYAVSLLAAFFIEGHVSQIFARHRMQKAIETLSGHYIVCGDAPATWHVAEELVRTKRSLVLVTPTEELLDEALHRLGTVPGVAGDPGDDRVLLQAGIERAAGVVAAMQSDKDNVIVTLTARRLAPRARIVASIAQPQNEAKVRMAGANAVVSPHRIGGLRMASEMVRPTVVSFLDQMLRERGGSLRVEEVRVPEGSPRVGMPLSDLGLEDLPGVVLLAMRREGGRAFHFKPAADSVLQAGTALLLMTDAQGREALEARIGA